jgi:hypothetical protein
MDQHQELNEVNDVKAKREPNCWVKFRCDKLKEGVKNADIKDLYYSEGNPGFGKTPKPRKARKAHPSLELADGQGEIAE